MIEHQDSGAHYARYLLLSGHVQGVGFRPFVYRLASEFGITGWVENRIGQVAIHAEGRARDVQQFEQNLTARAPMNAAPILKEARNTATRAYPQFVIRASSSASECDIRIIPDLPVCASCRTELFTALDRRFHYPFINCTNCGPRYTLIEQLPYDRANTTMKAFPLCEACAAEYSDPEDRRFHAEPTACPVCGPALEYQDKFFHQHESGAALAACVQALREGAIVAVKGLGGYHLMCDARNDQAVERLRVRKPRPHKPLAVMLAPMQVPDYVAPNQEQLRFLHGPVHPIVLIKKRKPDPLSALIAPGLREVGVMLPYSPLHVLLLHHFPGPLVATSANISGEPVLTDNLSVHQRLDHVFDACLHHNRAIVRPADDAVYRDIAGKVRPLRLGRGNSPLEIDLPFTVASPTLATGGHMKNTVALAWDRRIVVSPHIGDLDAPRSRNVFAQVVEDLQHLYQVTAERVVCDAHPDYGSSRWARNTGLPLSLVLHHHAHASAVAGEYPQEQRWLVFTWDGTGMGADQTLWGGEALLGEAGHWQRAASMRPFRLPGGDRAGREPWRSAAALCWETRVSWQAPIASAELVRQAWEKHLNCAQSSAVGRLFDAAAALIMQRHQSSFEGQGPMELEALAAEGDAEFIALPLTRNQQGTWITDWQPLLPVLTDTRLPPTLRARCFHETLAHALLQQALMLKKFAGEFAVGLTGGVFQNRLLAGRVMDLLQGAGLRCYLPERLPVNDGGLAFGQIVHSHFAAATTRDQSLR